MILKVFSLTDDAMEMRELCNMMHIEMDGNFVFSVYDGEPEDNNLRRNFNDCWNIPELMKFAYDAGLDGETFLIENKKISMEEMEEL